jgi:hypothetical protein
MESDTITMTTQEAERLTIINNLIARKINGTDAGKQLRLSVRQVKRLKARVIKKGASGIVHGLRGKKSNQRIPKKLLAKAQKLITKNYGDFGPTLATEKLQELHAITLSVTTIRQMMIREKLFRPRKRKQSQEHRSWRERKECYGEMEQFDGGYHHWFENRGEETCLLASIDDATGKLTKLKFGTSESVIEVWKEYTEAHGKPGAIYLDKFSTYKINHKSAKDNHELMTQFERACQDLSITLITAHSPQAKGRVERLFETLQDRLVKELRLRNISNIETANQFVETTYLADFNKRFAVVPTKDTDLHRSLMKHDQEHLDRIFSIQSTRQVKNDFTVQFQNNWYQLEAIQKTTVYQKDDILVEERLDGSIHLSKKGIPLTFQKLPSRPEKVNTKVVALTPRKPDWTPPANHPWRKQINADIQATLTHQIPPG